jgi:exosome complex RNA-binding protein Csl4
MIRNPCPDLIHASFSAASACRSAKGISGNVVSGSLMLAQVIDNRRGRVLLEVIVVSQSASTARVEAIDAEVDVVAGGRMLVRAERLDVAGKALRAAENPPK